MRDKEFDKMNMMTDMEIMVPHQRFVMRPAMRLLPRVLPDLYLKLTA
jgi:hypothetical protein